MQTNQQKMYNVYLTYLCQKHQTRIVIQANSYEEARDKALKQNPNAKIEGPGSILLFPSVQATIVS
jgi:hypothetical protein